MDKKENEFIKIVKLFSDELSSKILAATDGENAVEIRLRSGKPLCIYFGAEPSFIKADRLVNRADGECLSLCSREIRETLSRISRYTIYSKQSEITKGYFTIAGGHRIGICSTYLANDNVDFGAINAINIRIAHEMVGCSGRLVSLLNKTQETPSLLLVGAPLSGKTTVLRDLTRAYSSYPFYKKVALIDERREIASVYCGAASLDVGVCTDVLDGYPRHIASSIATRTLSPDIIVCDEIGETGDAEELYSASLCGIKVFATAHAKSRNDLKNKRYFKELLEQRIFDYIVFLNGYPKIGSIKEIVKAEEI